METATSTRNNEAKVIRSHEHQVVADQFCGKLTVLPNGTVMANGFANNIGHSHSLFDETYLVLEGDLRMALYNPETGIITEISLQKLDAIQIPRGTGHKVIGGSNDNCIMVSCEPRFISGDEVSCAELEQRYASTPTNMPAKLNLSDSRLFPER